ncbi:MAG: DUF4135 domain-containing protein [Lachnospiraceae bacterium]|nr:DUF4135 domain-containing protein [Lachnospiraceae bacterium]
MKLTMDDYVEILRQSGCYDFLQGPSETAVEEIITASPDGGKLLSDEAKRAMEKGFCRRMEPVYMNPMQHLVREAIQEIDPLAEKLPFQADRETVERAARQVRKRMGLGIGAALEEKYPLICEYTARIRKNYISSQAELLNRVAQYGQEISGRLLNGQPIEYIQTLSADSGDMHRHGRTVQRIDTNAGAFYYKPHDCRFEALYKDFVDAVLPDHTLAPAVVCGDDCGFEEELKARELESSEQVSEYYYNFGMLTALFHAIGSTDMHGENIMACGIYPSAIDLETMVRGKISKSAISSHPRKTPYTPAEEDINYCVDIIGVLPVTLIKGCYLSALHKSNGGSNSLPEWKGQKLEVIGYEQDFIEGFRAGYDRALENRDRLLSLTQAASEMTYRYVARNTTYYYYIKTKLFEAGALMNHEGRDAVLKRLEVPYIKRNMPVIQEMVDYEAGCLCEGDIPYFCAKVGGHALCGENSGHVLRDGYWSMSAAEVMHTSLQRLSPKERKFETDYISTRLDHAPLPEAKPAECPVLPDKMLPAADARALCGELLHKLEADSVRAACGTTIWHSGVQDIEKDPSCGMSTHYAEAVLYCTTILSEPSLTAFHTDAARIARMCLEELKRFAERLENESSEFLRFTIPLGLDCGIGGILMAVREAARVGIAGAEEQAERYLRIICRNRLYQDRVKAGGEAGLILAVAALPGSPQSVSMVNELIIKCADALLEQPLSDSPMTEALRGAALSEAFRFSGDERYVQASSDAFENVRAAYLPHIPGWTEGKPGIAWLAKSAGQEGGIALCAMHAVNEPGTGFASEVRDLGLTALRKRQTLSRSDSLYDGNALRALGLIRAAEIQGQKDDLVCAGRLLAGMVLRKDQNGCFICSPDGIRSFFDVSFRRGTLGIGYAVLAYLKALRILK